MHIQRLVHGRAERNGMKYLHPTMSHVVFSCIGTDAIATAIDDGLTILMGAVMVLGFGAG